MTKEQTPKRQYVDSAAFLLAMQERIKLVKEAEEQGLPKPRITDFLGECIFKIATNFSNLRNFNGYPFKEDMILDAVENCLKVIDNFDDKITQNPFSYFTQITYFAFLRRISKEKKQVYIRSKLLTSNALDLNELQEHDEQGDFTNNYIEYMKAFNNFDGSSFEKTKKEKVIKEIDSPFEDFYG
jgi:hypothetical protein